MPTVAEIREKYSVVATERTQGKPNAAKDCPHCHGDWYVPIIKTNSRGVEYSSGVKPCPDVEKHRSDHAQIISIP
jgi:hypothetical protein